MFRPTEQELKTYAEMKAESIVIRSYDKKGNSSDDRRKTTELEKKIISTIIFGGLLAIRSGADKQSVKDACEYIGKLQIPEMKRVYGGISLKTACQCESIKNYYI